MSRAPWGPVTLLYIKLGFHSLSGRREALLTVVEKVLIPEQKKFAAFIANLPGMRALPIVDKHRLLKCEYNSDFNIHTSVWPVQIEIELGGVEVSR